MMAKAVITGMALLSGLLLPAGNAIAQDVRGAMLYTLCSKCNIVLERSGEAADVEIDSRKYKARISADPNNPEFKTVHAGKELLFRVSISEEESFILNDHYQQGCEAAKLILLNDPSDSLSADALRRYLHDSPYVLDDTAAMFRKARFMRAHGWNAYGAPLLETMLENYPEMPEAWLLLADIYNEIPDRRSEAKATYAEYIKRFSKGDRKNVAPAKRGY